MSVRFSEVLGHEMVKELLSKELDTGRLASFYLLAGPDGTGKTMLARAFGRYFLCGEGRSDGCACGSCRRFAGGGHPDYLELGAGEGAEMKMEDAVAARDFLRLKAVEGRGRFVLAPDAERMNASAQNALLKTLEEPPPGTVLFFTSSRPEKFLDTVTSRARVLRSGGLPLDVCRKVLEGLGVKAKEAEFLASLAGGSPGRALEYREVSGSVREAASALAGMLDEGVAPFTAAGPVLERLASLDSPAERRLFLTALTAALCGIFRRRLGPFGSEPLGSMVSVLTEAYRAAQQNVRPEVVVLVMLHRLRKALDGDVSPLCGVVI